MGRITLQKRFLDLIVLEKEIQALLTEIDDGIEKAVLEEDLAFVKQEQEKIKEKIYQCFINNFEDSHYSFNSLQGRLNQMLGKTPKDLKVEKAFEEFELEEDLQKLKKKVF